MVELVVISGKGGTGKTSITAALAYLAAPVVLADCDVDAPDLHLLADPVIEQCHAFSGGKRARVEADDCCGCGQCVDVCRFDAIHAASGNAVVGMTCHVDPLACEGCGACVSACPAGAMRFEPVTRGERYRSRTRFGPMVHARLHPGEENSGKLASEVRRAAREVAAERGLPLILVDGSPGIGCPVIASLIRADHALIVAEPTPSGQHDALRVMELVSKLSVPASLCVNRFELNGPLAEELEAEARSRGVPPVGRIGEDRAFVDAQMHGRSLIEFAETPAARDLRHLWSTLSIRCGLIQGVTDESRRSR